MSIRYKTILIFLATGLIPFLAIGVLVFIDFQTSLRDNAFRHLEAVSSLQEDRVIDHLAVYAQGATYVSEQPAVRQAVQTFLKDPNTKAALHQALMNAQAGDPQGAVGPVQEATITDPAGKVLDSTSPHVLGTMLPVRPDLLLADMYTDKHGTYLRFSAPMLYDGKTLARFYMTIDAQGLFAITNTYDGLGETGETFLVKRQGDANGLFVTPLRFDVGAAFTKKVSLDEANRPSAQALLEKNQTFTDGVISYRNEPVVAVTKYMPRAGLGIVGQIDQAEVFGPIKQLGSQVIVFAALLVLFTIFVGSFMAQLFVRPLLSLAAAATKLSRGDFSAKTKVWSNDEIGQLGHAFNQMAADLARQDQAKSDVIALISHQLRTPVTAVKGFVSLLLEDKSPKLSPQKEKMLQQAFVENEKLNKLITQILEVAHADSGKLKLTKVPTDLNKLVTSVLRDHQSIFDLRKQKIQLATASRPTKIAIDPEKIKVVLGNLLTNASKYSPRGSEIKVELDQTSESVQIRVVDSGFGIKSANQEKLFKKFSRIENQDSDTSEGVGLGLYMAKKIVDLHKGNLTVHSSENRGSSFTIELPTNA